MSELKKLSRQLNNNTKFLPNSERTSTENFVNWNVNDLLSSKDGWIWSYVTQLHSTIFCHLTAIVMKRWQIYFPSPLKTKSNQPKLIFLETKSPVCWHPSLPAHISFPELVPLLYCSHSSLRWNVFSWSCLISKYCWSNSATILMHSAGFLQPSQLAIKIQHCTSNCYCTTSEIVTMMELQKAMFISVETLLFVNDFWKMILKTYYEIRCSFCIRTQDS